MILTTDGLGNILASSSPTAGFYLATSTTATSTFAGGLTVGNNAAFVVNQAATANSLYVANNGNVGIGTAAPAEKLNVNGSLRVDNTSGTSYLKLSDDNTAYVGAYGSDADLLLTAVRNINFATSYSDTGANSGTITMGKGGATGQVALSVDLTINDVIIKRDVDGGGTRSEDGTLLRLERDITNVTSESGRFLEWGNTGTTLGAIDKTGVLTLTTTDPAAATSTINGNLFVNGTLRGSNVYTGDLFFANNWSITEAPLGTSTQGLLIRNQDKMDVFTVDEMGNLSLAGDVCYQGNQCFGKSFDSLSNYISILASSTAESLFSSQATTTASLSELTVSINILRQDINALNERFDIVSPATVQLINTSISSLNASTTFVNIIASSTADTLASSTPSFVARIAVAVMDYLKSATDWVFAKITSTLAIFNRVETQTAAVTQGLEMTDQATGEIYCVTITNGEWLKLPGSCSTVQTNLSSPATTTSETISTPPTSSLTPSEYPIVIATSTENIVQNSTLISTSTSTSTSMSTTSISTTTPISNSTSITDMTIPIDHASSTSSISGGIIPSVPIELVSPIESVPISDSAPEPTSVSVSEPTPLSTQESMPELNPALAPTSAPNSETAPALNPVSEQ